MTWNPLPMLEVLLWNPNAYLKLYFENLWLETLLWNSNTHFKPYFETPTVTWNPNTDLKAYFENPNYGLIPYFETLTPI